MVLLDTHALVWLDEGNDRLGPTTRVFLDEALQSNDLYVSAISFWEVAMLVAKGRFEMQMGIDRWRHTLLDGGLQEVALAGDVAMCAANLRSFHGDPADRMIVATALHLTASLCTADEKILKWRDELSRIDARL